ncbi:MAG: DUF4238 domain-containing protein [Gallionellaceae bacterium]
MKKTKQHYVWRNYLKSWTSNGSIWCSRKGKVFPSDLMNIGQERYFYKLKELTENDIKFVIKFAIEPIKHKLLRELNTDWLNLFNLIFKLKNFVKEKGVIEPELNEQIELAIHNMEEDYHQSIEGNAIKHIDSILAKDISFFQTEKGRMDFAYFLCVQYMRTKKRQEAMCNQFKNQDNPYLEGVNMENAWSVMRHIYATNMGFSLFADSNRFKMVLINNESTTPFITGDQPVINTYAAGGSNKHVSDVEFYYPVSPRLAILISPKSEYQSVNEFDISDVDAHAFNIAMLKASHEQIYADSEATIANYSACSGL